MFTHENSWLGALSVTAVVVFAISLRAALSDAQQPDEPTLPAGTAERLADFKASGRDASLTVLPTGLVGRPLRQVGEVIALMLERAGMTKLEIDAVEFTPPEQADMTQTAEALADYLKANPIRTDYALFADFLGTREKGFEEVRIVITNAHGELVWQDRQTPNDAAFKRIRPQEPMQCCLLVVERLRPVLGLDDPTRDSAPEGRLAKRWAERTGLPDKAEQGAMQERQQAFKRAGGTATLLVYPSLAADEESQDSAAHLTNLVNQAQLARATAADTGPQLKIAGNMNEQKVLWDMAHGVGDFVRNHPPDAEYVLFAHYLMGRDPSGKVMVGGVHFTVCDREGRWVIVDFQNSHHDDFRAIQPQSRDDCDQLVLRRLRNYCR